MKRYVIIIYFSVLSVALNAQTLQDTIAKIDSIFFRYKKENPGCQLSISRNGKIILSKTWGMADLERNVPLTINSIVEAGSISKQFTAAAILLLEQQKKLSLNDDIRKYIPELPDYGKTIRIKHLIHHTSGLKDWGDIAEISGWPRTTKAYNNIDALQIICQQSTLNNNPGEEMLYSNSNYNLLAIIVERVSGISLAQYTAKYIFIPANMSNTQWRNNYKRIVSNRALAYSKTGNGYETDMPNENAYGNAGLLTTSEDLIKWNEFYLTEKFGSPSLLKKLIALDTLNNGEINHFAAGLYVHKKNGLNCINYSGSTAGYRCYLAYYPQLDISISFLSNTSEYGSSSAVKEIENIFTGKNETSNAKDKTDNVVFSNNKNFIGWYKNVNSGQGLCFSIKNNKLNLFENMPLRQINESEFILDNIYFSFQKNNLLKVVRPNEFGAGTMDTLNYIKITDSKSEKKENEYLGDYYSRDALVSSTIIKNDSNQLILILKPGELLKLTPTYTDGFYIDSLESNLYFERDENNRIIKMYISEDRARNVGFDKIK
jgi:CubicO group peptidase (beta-lactamase class C family)